MRFGPLAPFPVWAFVLLSGIIALLVSLVVTWWLSRVKDGNISTWRRWYAIATIAVLSLSFDWFLLDENSLAYRNFYLPAEGMTPTLLKGDRFVAHMRPPGQWKRGNVVLVRGKSRDIYVKRLVGFPGDRIAVTNAIVVLNGRPISQRLISTEPVSYGFESFRAKRFEEQFPGEP